jgi:hypothetical protein
MKSIKDIKVSAIAVQAYSGNHFGNGWNKILLK